jgi:hypothetical protein
MGAHYRHTTPEMAAQAVEAIQQRLTIVLHVTEQAPEPESTQPEFVAGGMRRGRSEEACLGADGLIGRPCRLV